MTAISVKSVGEHFRLNETETRQLREFVDHENGNISDSCWTIFSDFCFQSPSLYTVNQKMLTNKATPILQTRYQLAGSEASQRAHTLATYLLFHLTTSTRDNPNERRPLLTARLLHSTITNPLEQVIDLAPWGDGRTLFFPPINMLHELALSAHKALSETLTGYETAWVGMQQLRTKEAKDDFDQLTQSASYSRGKELLKNTQYLFTSSNGQVMNNKGTILGPEKLYTLWQSLLSGAEEIWIDDRTKTFAV